MEERIKKVLGDVKKDILLYEGNDLIEDGIIDSLEVVEIVAALEKEFQIEITADDIVMEKFQNIDTINELIRQKLI